MPFKEVSIMTQRREFVQLASAEDANVRERVAERHISLSAHPGGTAARFKGNSNAPDASPRSRRATGRGWGGLENRKKPETLVRKPRDRKGLHFPAR